MKSRLLQAKGQVTLSEFVRQLVDLDKDGGIAFNVGKDEVGASHADWAHIDPAIITLLNLLKADIRAGRNINALPQDLARTMQANAGPWPWPRPRYRG